MKKMIERTRLAAVLAVALAAAGGAQAIEKSQFYWQGISGATSEWNDLSAWKFRN